MIRAFFHHRLFPVFVVLILCQGMFNVVALACSGPYPTTGVRVSVVLNKQDARYGMVSTIVASDVEVLQLAMEEGIRFEESPAVGIVAVDLQPTSCGSGPALLKTDPETAKRIVQARATGSITLTLDSDSK